MNKELINKRKKQKKRRNSVLKKVNKHAKYKKIIVVRNLIEPRSVEKEKFIDDKGKVKFNLLKYNLGDLFKNPPLFDVPPMSFNNSIVKMNQPNQSKN